MNGYAANRFIASLASILVAAACSNGLLCAASGEQVKETEEYDRLLTAASSEGGSRSFDALLRLRDFREEKGIPVLESIIQKHCGTGTIWEFAAAQVLFCIGSPKAHDILKRYLLKPEYSTSWGMRYTFGWELDQSKRDAFIAQYHLKPTSADLEVQLTCQGAGEAEKGFEFRIVLRNATDKPIRIYDPKVYLAKMLVIQDSEGHFVWNQETVDYRMPFGEECFPELPPRSHYGFLVPGDPQWVDSRPWKNQDLPQPQALVLQCGDVFHAIGRPGKITVQALYSVDKRSAEAWARRLSLPQVWVGRVVSKPLEIEVP